jgi:hypothetical protein
MRRARFSGQTRGISITPARARQAGWLSLTRAPQMTVATCRAWSVKTTYQTDGLIALAGLSRRDHEDLHCRYQACEDRLG